MGPKERDVAWTATALEQLIESLEYLTERAPAAAEELYDQAMSAAASLATLSERGRIVPELGGGTIRELLVGSHRLLYDVSPDHVTIVGFVYGARDFARWWRDRRDRS